jgi:uncharacterized membrane protein YqhA
VFKHILVVRYFYVIAVIFTFVNSLFFLYGGVLECITGYNMILDHGMSAELKPGLYLLKGLEHFLISMVFMIFALGILKLFIFDHTSEEHIPSWLKIDEFKELKVLLWESILVTLVVFTLDKLVSATEVLTWNALIFPGVILALTASLYLMKKSH